MTDDEEPEVPWAFDSNNPNRKRFVATILPDQPAPTPTFQRVAAWAVAGSVVLLFVSACVAGSVAMLTWAWGKM